MPDLERLERRLRVVRQRLGIGSDVFVFVDASATRLMCDVQLHLHEVGHYLTLPPTVKRIVDDGGTLSRAISTMSPMMQRRNEARARAFQVAASRRLGLRPYYHVAAVSVPPDDAIRPAVAAELAYVSTVVLAEFFTILPLARRSV